MNVLRKPDLSRLVKINSVNRQVNISIDRQDIAERFLELVDEWLENPTSHCPHIFSLIFEVFERIRVEFSGLKDGVCDHYFNFQKNKRFGDSHTGHIDRVFEYLEAEESLSHQTSLSLKFVTKQRKSIDFFGSGSFFEKGQADYLVGGRKEYNTKYFNVVIENGPERIVQTAKVMEYSCNLLKTQANHQIELNNFSLGEVKNWLCSELQRRLDKFPPERAAENLYSAKYERDSAVVAYVCAATHRYYVCECFREGERFWIKDLPARAKENGWAYMKGICHLCTKEVPEECQFETYFYDSIFKSTYNPWINYRCCLALGDKYSKYGGSNEKQEAMERISNALQVEVDWGQWQNEKFLYLSLKRHFDDRFDVEYQSRPKFLKLQSFDVFIPKIGVAVEYDGEQHYNEDTYFARKSDFRKIQERDLRKDQLAEKNGIFLIRVRRGYSLERLIARIEGHISKPF